MTKEVKVRDAHYYRIHRWLRSNYGDACRCEICNSTQTKKYEWAKKEGCVYDYNRNNFIMLCPSCHRKYDETSQTRFNKSKGHLGQKSIRQKGVVAIIEGNETVFTSITEASLITGIGRTSIQNKLSGLTKNTGGIIWRYL